LEAAGVIEAVGKGVSNLKPSDRIGYITSRYRAYASHRVLDKIGF
jgi:Zn-dependent alcohol dehydrogenase